MTTPRAVLDHILSSIAPASEAQTASARQRIAQVTAPRQSLGAVERIAERLAGARHAPQPKLAKKTVVVCAADHGVADPGVDLGENAPTVVALRHIADGHAALNTAARGAGANIVLIDCGVRGGDRYDLGAGVLDFRITDGTADFRATAAMTPIDALQSVQSGIAALFSLADTGLDLLALGQVSAGAPTVAGVVIAATCGNAADFDIEDRDAIQSALATAGPAARDPLERLANLGGPDLGVMVGMILGAASINIPVVLDDHFTWAAALIATELAPDSVGYLIASHAGAFPAHRAALSHLGLEPLFDLGISHGEGTGAALALPLLDAAAKLLVD